jgi:YVTN family beta-propeller protein
MNIFPSLRAQRSNPEHLAPALDCRVASLLAMTRPLVPALMVLLFTNCAAAERIFVSNEKDNTVTVLDGQTLAITDTVKVGQRPRAILLSTDGKSLYICASDSDRIEVLDIATLKIVGKLPSGADPERFDTSPDGKLLYIANENDNKISVLDVAAGKVISEIPVGIEPEGMATSPDGKVVVGTSETTSMAHFVAASHKVVKKINFDIPGLTSGHAQPVDIKVTKDGKTAFVALGPANRVAVVDAKSYAVQKYILVGQRVWNMAFSPDQKRLLTANGVSNDITIIDVADQKPVKSVPVGRSPWGVAVAP